MKGSPHEIPAGQFKARCLALLDRVQRTGEPLIVTKHGRPVATIAAVKPKKHRSLMGSVKFHGDIVGPSKERWEMDR